MIETKNLRAIESTIIAKTGEANEILKKTQLLKNDLLILKESITLELKKTTASVRNLSSEVQKNSLKLNDSISSSLDINLSNESLDELALALNNLQQTMQNNKPSKYAGYIVEFLLMIVAYFAISYLSNSSIF